MSQGGEAFCKPHMSRQQHRLVAVRQACQQWVRRAGQTFWKSRMEITGGVTAAALPCSASFTRVASKAPGALGAQGTNCTLPSLMSFLRDLHTLVKT